MEGRLYETLQHVRAGDDGWPMVSSQGLCVWLESVAQDKRPTNLGSVKHRRRFQARRIFSLERKEVAVDTVVVLVRVWYALKRGMPCVSACLDHH